MAIETNSNIQQQYKTNVELQPSSSLSSSNDSNKMHDSMDSGKPISTPRQSIKSENISISSLRTSDSSSFIDSDDSDYDEYPIDSNGKWKNAPSHPSDIINTNSNGIIVLNQNPVDTHKTPVIINGGDDNLNGLMADATRQPQIGSIAVQNSSDITFGNKTFYQGPVTIKQFLLEKDRWKLQQTLSGPIEMMAESGGITNAGYVTTSAIDSNVKNNESQRTENDKSSDSNKRKKYFRHFFKFKSKLAIVATIATLTAAILFIIIIISITTTNLFGNHYDKADSNKDNSSSLINQHNYEIVSRAEWFARPSTVELPNLNLPALHVIISHTATSMCSNKWDCMRQVRSIQDYHIIKKGWNDIGYNYLIGGDGRVYEGVGLLKMGSHTYGYNQNSFGISFMGNFMKISPTSKQIYVALQLIDDLRRQEMIIVNYKLYGHRQLSNTKSPGDYLYEIIQKWPKWESHK